MPPVAIPDDLAAMIGGPTLMIASVRDDRFRATIGRGTGAVRGDGRIDIFISAAQWPDTIAHASDGGDIALTFANPANYRCWQVKGRIDEAAPATPDELARTRLYTDRIQALLDTLGVNPRLLTHMASVRDLRRLRVSPYEVFNQTPGPGAGSRIAGAAA